jgi:hypothetical protein
MRQVTKTVYTARELKALDARAFERALEKYREELTLEYSQEEMMSSLKGLCDAAGVRIRDYSLGAYNRGNMLRVDMPGDPGAGDLTGPRALAWIENRILGPLRAPWGLPKLTPGAPLPEGYTRGWDPVARAVSVNESASRLITRWTKPGAVPSCPFTGVCYDEDFLSALIDDVKGGRGRTLKEAFEGLESDFARMLEDEIEYQSEEEQFLEAAEANEWEYDADGDMV